MIRVKLSTNFPDWPLIRQTPGSSGVWGDCRFFINEDNDECDFWVVYDDVLRPETTRCPPENTLLITGEPPSVKTYHPRFTAQFARVLTCQRGLKHPNVIYSQQALPWMIGCRYVSDARQWDPSYSKDYDELSAMPAVPKTKLLSVLSSDKAFTPGHNRRLAFVEALQKRFGSEIDVFGRGIRPVEDKWDAIAPYKYHVVIENGQFPDYWTEKLSDALLAGTYPLYVGCPNVFSYFPESSLTVIDILDFEAALEVIQTTIAQKTYEATRQEGQAAKSLVLDTYNMFPVIANLAGDLSSTHRSERMTVQPNLQHTANSVEAIKNILKRIVKPNK